MQKGIKIKIPKTEFYFYFYSPYHGFGDGKVVIQLIIKVWTEGRLLLDPQHKGTSFPLMPKDREGRQCRVSTQSRSSISGLPHPVIRHLAAPEPELLTGNPSPMATSSDQSTGLLLQQLMTEMKYLKEKVDASPHVRYRE
jgi:hypothetical protein